MVEGIRKWLAVVMVGLLAAPAGMAAAGPGDGGEGAASPRAGDCSNWTYYRELTFDTPTSVDGLQVPLELNNTTSFDYGHAGANGNDLRFVNDDGNEQSYWIEEWNTSGISRVWINVSKSGTTGLRMCYGNPAAPAMSNGTNTYLFFDDFNDGIYTDKWNVTGGPYGSYAESNGELTLTSQYVGPGQGFAYLLAKRKFDGPFIIEWRMRLVNGGRAGIEIVDPVKNQTFNEGSVIDYLNGHINWEMRGSGDFGGPWPGKVLAVGPLDQNGWNEMRGIAHNYTWQVYRGSRIESWLRNDTLNLDGDVRTREFQLNIYSHEYWNTVSKWDWLRIRTFADAIPAIDVSEEHGDYSAWKYSLDLQLDSPTLVDGLQVLLRLNASSFDYSKASSKGDDIRFIDGSGYGLNYWIDVWNTTGESRIWIKVHRAGTDSLRMYFGNPDAPAASDGDRTFEFFDDFNDGIFLDKWFKPGANTYGTYDESGGILTLTGKWVSPGTGWASLATLTNISAPFIVDWRAQKIRGQNMAIEFGDMVSSTFDAQGELNDWRIRASGDFGGAWPGKYVSCGNIDYNWHEFRGLAHNSTWEVLRGNMLDSWTRDDALVLDADMGDRAFKMNIYSHEMGDTVSKWDWIRIRKHADKIPIVEIGRPALSLSVEKGSYLPGEAVMARSRLTFEGSSWAKPLPSRNISFEIDDPAGMPYFLETDATDQAGNATASFALPADAPEGLYACYATANISGVLLEANTTFTVRWPWAPVFRHRSNLTERPYYPDEWIGLEVYAGYEYSPAGGNKSAQAMMLSLDVYDPLGTNILKLTRSTNDTGWADLSFPVPEVHDKVILTARITGFEDLERSIQFNAQPRINYTIPHIILKDVTSPASVNRGAAFTIELIIENTFQSSQNCLLVIQLLDSNNVPLRPRIKPLNVTVGPGFLANVTMIIDPKSPAGVYSVQVQLLTGLPKDRGYALDFRNGSINVQ